MIRRAIPILLLPLCLVATVLAASPWLRAFPADIAAVPLYGAALLSVLIPGLVAFVAPRRLWLAALIDLVAFVIYTLAVVLRQPFGFSDLYDGLYHGPSQLLTFALPLVSPRSLMVAPVALTWLAGALAAECVARRWFTVLPYAGFLVAFGLAYAGTARAVTGGLSAAHLHETLLAGGLLVTLLLLRAAQSWIRQDETAESTQADGVLPLRGLIVGAVTTVLIALVAGFAVQADAFSKHSATPQRVPPVNDSRPLTPVSFISGLRPRDPKAGGRPVFTVSLDRPAEGYFSIANVDYYDGSDWSFDRTFRPSGGVLPADSDSTLRTSTPAVTQNYRIADGPLSSAPWMPTLYRAQKVTGAAVNIDPSSGMIVPTQTLQKDQQYTVRSGATTTTFDQLKGATAAPDSASPAIDTEIPATLRTNLDQLITTFSDATGTPRTPAIPFLQALQKDLRTKYSLTGAVAPTPSGPSASATGTAPGNHLIQPLLKTPAHTTPAKKAPAKKKTAKKPGKKKPAKKPVPHTTPKATPTPTTSAPAADRAGSTSFADVLASIGTQRSGTPEQFATLIALVARELGVPARIATGFRVTPKSGSGALAAGRYDVTTAEAWTWAEVPVTGVGWVVLDSAPGQYTDTQPSSSAAAPPPPSASATPSQNAQITKGNGGHAVAKKSTVAATTSHAQRGVLIALLIVIGVLLALLLLLLALRKALRRARRNRSPDPRTRLLGAWQESLDVLSEAGLPPLTNLTNSEVAEVAGREFGPEPATQAAYIGQAANSVVYSRATVISPDEADAAWQAQRTLRKSVRRQLGARGRVAANLRYTRAAKADPLVGPQSWATSDAAGIMAGSRKRRGRRRAH